MGLQVPVLLYHRVDHSNDFIATKPDVFRRHLQYLAERGWRSMSLKEFEACSKAGQDFPDRRFLLTFDDGYDSLAHTAAPIMEEFEFSGVAFICPHFMARDGTAYAGRRDELYKGFLNWEQARSLQASGTLEFQSHSHTHSNFAEFTATEIADDLLLSVNILSQELRLPRHYFRHLAWPWGNSTREWRMIAQNLGFEFQYTVARTSFQKNGTVLEIPRVCFDAQAFEAFQRQFWLQTGALATPWNAAYGMARSAKQMVRALRARAGSENLEAAKAKVKKAEVQSPPAP